MSSVALLFLAGLAQAVPVTVIDGSGSSSLHPGQIGYEVGRTFETVRDHSLSETKVYIQGRRLHEAVTRAPVAVRADFQGWPTEPSPDYQDPPSLKRLRDDAQARRFRISAAPPPPLKEVVERADSMYEGGRMHLDKDWRLHEHEAGLYEYERSKPESGRIWFSAYTPLIAQVIGPLYAQWATECHESAHALTHEKGELSPEKVVEGELVAFQAQFQCLNFVDPGGWRLAKLRAILMKEMRYRATQLKSLALKYVTALDLLMGTRGEEDRIREYIKNMGYQEGHERRPPGPVSS
ncbi:MAG: hypothetical protein HY549_10245 [Elusimicrobia bacterium]|nr:hypothetical protein [Elusimicrobiota bacterium]